MTGPQLGGGGGRSRRIIAGSILGVLLVGGAFATVGSGDPPEAALIHAVVLVLAFWFPAMRLEAPRDLVAQGRSLVVWLLAWTLVWDLATAGVLGSRTVFQEWWLVYPSGVVVLGGLLLLHTWLARRTDSGPLDSGD